MTISASDFITIDRQVSGSGNSTVVNLYGTTANVATVTQLTSRTTGVTINNPVGNIVLFSVANSQTDATFTVTNSFVEAGDVILVSQKSGTDPQRAAVTAVSAGSFKITCAAISGTTVESPVFNFVVVKGTIV